MMIGQTEEIMYPLQRLELSPAAAAAEKSAIFLHRQPPSTNVKVELSNDEKDSPATSDVTVIDCVDERHSDVTDENASASPL